MNDLRVIALILDQGMRAAAAMEDAPLAAALHAMTEAAINYQLAEERAANIDDPTGLRGPELREAARGLWNLRVDFAALAAAHE